MLAAGQLDAALGYSFRLYIDLKDRGVPLDDIVLMPMANYGLKLYGSAIIVNSKFAAEKPEVVKAVLNAILKGLKETVRNPAEAVDSIVRRDDTAKKEVELERLRMAIRDNIVTPEVRVQRLRRRRPGAAGGVDRPDRAHLYRSSQTQGGGHLRCFVPAAGVGTPGQLNVTAGLVTARRVCRLAAS